MKKKHICCICHIKEVQVSGRRCKECDNKYNKTYYEKNRDHLLTKSKKYYRTHLEKQKLYAKKWRNENKEKIRILAKRAAERRKNDPEKCAEFNAKKRQYYMKNKKRMNAKARQWYQDNAEQMKICSKKWQKNNPEKYKEIYMKSNKKVLSTITGRLNSYIRGQIYPRFGTSKGFNKIVKYTMNDVKTHLESLFLKGMSWDDYGWGDGKYVDNWHMHHIKSYKFFNCREFGDKGFKQYWALENLCPRVVYS